MHSVKAVSYTHLHLVENAGKMGKYFKEKLTELQNKYSDKITDVRNAGLLIGIQLEDSIAKTCLLYTSRCV